MNPWNKTSQFWNNCHFNFSKCPCNFQRFEIMNFYLFKAASKCHLKVVRTLRFFRKDRSFKCWMKFPERSRCSRWTHWFSCWIVLILLLAKPSQDRSLSSFNPSMNSILLLDKFKILRWFSLHTCDIRINSLLHVESWKKERYIGTL